MRYVAVFLAALCLAGVIGWLPAAWLQPFRNAELRLLYIAATRGPGGLDDGVHMQIVNHPKRYAAPLIRMLEGAEPGSTAEEVGLYFIELVRGPDEVDAFLADYATRHPDPEVRAFVLRVLSSPTPQERMARQRT